MKLSSENLNTLIRYFSRNGMYSGKQLKFQLNIYCQFEPYGKASENWHTIYEVVIPFTEFQPKAYTFTSFEKESYHPELFFARIIQTLKNDGLDIQ